MMLRTELNPSYTVGTRVSHRTTGCPGVITDVRCTEVCVKFNEDVQVYPLHLVSSYLWVWLAEPNRAGLPKGAPLSWPPCNGARVRCKASGRLGTVTTLATVDAIRVTLDDAGGGWVRYGEQEATDRFEFAVDMPSILAGDDTTQLHEGDVVVRNEWRSGVVPSGSIGTITCIAADGSISVQWHDPSVSTLPGAGLAHPMHQARRALRLYTSADVTRATDTGAFAIGTRVIRTSVDSITTVGAPAPGARGVVVDGTKAGVPRRADRITVQWGPQEWNSYSQCEAALRLRVDSGDGFFAATAGTAKIVTDGEGVYLEGKFHGGASGGGGGGGNGGATGVVTHPGLTTATHIRPVDRDKPIWGAWIATADGWEKLETDEERDARERESERKFFFDKRPADAIADSPPAPWARIDKQRHRVLYTAWLDAFAKERHLVAPYKDGWVSVVGASNDRDATLRVLPLRGTRACGSNRVEGLCIVGDIVEIPIGDLDTSFGAMSEGGIPLHPDFRPTSTPSWGRRYGANGPTGYWSPED